MLQPVTKRYSTGLNCGETLISRVNVEVCVCRYIFYTTDILKSPCTRGFFPEKHGSVRANQEIICFTCLFVSACFVRVQTSFVAVADRLLLRGLRMSAIKHRTHWAISCIFHGYIIFHLAKVHGPLQNIYYNVNNRIEEAFLLCLILQTYMAIFACGVMAYHSQVRRAKTSVVCNTVLLIVHGPQASCLFCQNLTSHTLFAPRAYTFFPSMAYASLERREWTCATIKRHRAFSDF